MDKKMFIIAAIIIFISGCVFTGAAGYIFFYRPAMVTIGAELATSRADAELYRARAEYSERRIEDIRITIDRGVEALGGTITTISTAREKIRTALETIKLIREKLSYKELGNIQ